MTLAHAEPTIASELERKAQRQLRQRIGILKVAKLVGLSTGTLRRIKRDRRSGTGPVLGAYWIYGYFHNPAISRARQDRRLEVGDLARRQNRLKRHVLRLFGTRLYSSPRGSA